MQKFGKVGLETAVCCTGFERPLSVQSSEHFDCAVHKIWRGHCNAPIPVNPTSNIDTLVHTTREPRHTRFVAALEICRPHGINNGADI